MMTHKKGVGSKSVKPLGAVIICAILPVKPLGLRPRGLTDRIAQIITAPRGLTITYLPGTTPCLLLLFLSFWNCY